MIKKGIDISYCDKNVNYDNLDIDFAIIRAGYGREVSQKDAMFEKHYAGLKKAGIPVGAYWYSYALTETDAIKEANACIEVLKNKQFEYPIYFDVEEKKQFALGKANVSAIIKAFCDILEKAGYFVGVYMSKSPLMDYVTDEVKQRYSIWVAQYNYECTYTGHYGMWQYSSSGQVPAITGVSGVDMDYCYLDYPSIIIEKGLNGFTKKTTDHKWDSIHVVTTINGKRYSGDLYAD